MAHQGLAWTFAGVLPAALLVGCVDGGGFGGSSARAVLQGQMTVSAPAGYCVDESASRETEDRAVVLMGRCDGQTSVQPAVLSYSVGPAGSAGAMAAGGAELAGFFTSAEGRATLSATGRARDVEIVEALGAGDAFLMRLRQNTEPSHWRAFLGLKGRLVSIAVQGSPDAPLAPEEGRKILDGAIAAMERQNRS
ncbi:MAG: cation transport ATPase [Pseudorhodobacter sp.]|nr:MAG: cation transport ATPase [Pseudorhodobacter sp.]